MVERLILNVTVSLQGRHQERATAKSKHCCVWSGKEQLNQLYIVKEKRGTWTRASPLFPSWAFCIDPLRSSKVRHEACKNPAMSCMLLSVVGYEARLVWRRPLGGNFITDWGFSTRCKILQATFCDHSRRVVTVEASLEAPGRMVQVRGMFPPTRLQSGSGETAGIGRPQWTNIGSRDIGDPAAVGLVTPSNISTAPWSD